MITLHKCAICKKQFSIFSMPGYVYRRNGKLFCGWNCMRAYDKKGVEPKRMAAKISTEQKQEAVKVALGGGDPVEYFRGLGSRDPQALWYTTRRALKTSDPAKHARLIAIAKGEAQAEEPALTPVPDGRLSTLALLEALRQLHRRLSPEEFDAALTDIRDRVAQCAPDEGA